MENIEYQEEDSREIIFISIKIGINAGETILSFVLLTYYKDVFFALTSTFIESAAFIHEDFSLEGVNIALFVMAMSIVVGIGLTICRYRCKTFGYEDVPILGKQN